MSVVPAARRAAEGIVLEVAVAIGMPWLVAVEDLRIWADASHDLTRGGQRRPARNVPGFAPENACGNGSSWYAERYESQEPRWRRRFGRFIGNLQSRQPRSGGRLYWDPAGNKSCSGGAGIWNTASWYSSGVDGPWNNGNAALFQGTGGVVTLNTQVTPTGLNFNVPGYSISSGGTLNFNASAAITTTTAPVGDD